jgi:hypothetical protein
VQTVIEISCHFGELASDKRLFLEVEHTFVPAGALLTLFGCALAEVLFARFNVVVKGEATFPDVEMQSCSTSRL